MRLRGPIVMILGIAGLASTMTACAQDRIPASPSDLPAAAAIESRDPLIISVDDVGYHVNLTSIHPGEPGVDVVFTNVGRLNHTLTFFTNPGTTTRLAGADTGFVLPGREVDFHFVPPDGALKIYYLCTIHPSQMYGWLSIEP